MAAPQVQDRAVRPFLEARYPDVSGVTLLSGGEWSAAFEFRSAGRPLVIRFGAHIEDYEKDQLGATWAAPDLPIPAVLEVGVAFDGAYAVSERKSGRPLEDLEPRRYPGTLEALFDTLAAIRRIELPGRGFGRWWAPDAIASHDSWGEFLLAVADRDDDRLRGWREQLSRAPEAHRAFRLAHRRLRSLVAACPDVRGVVHGDLLAGNVLVDGDRISAVIDWGSSVAGDPLYDVAWLSFWGRWHRGIDPGRVRRLAVERFGGADLDERLRCYELHTALDALQYQAFARRPRDLAWTTEQTLDLLDP